MMEMCCLEKFASGSADGDITWSESMRVTSDGKIGISDTSPENTLSIKNIGSFEGDANSFYLGSNFTGTGQNFSGSGKHAQRFFFNNASGNGYLKYENTGTSTGNAGDAITWKERFRITSAGLVGIGTASPEYQTTIAADGANAKLNIKRKTAAASNGNAFGSLFYTNSDGTDVASIRAHRESANDDAYLGFATRNTGGSISEKLRITSAGNVGIGENNPTSSLVIKKSNNSGVGPELVLNNSGGGYGDEMSILFSSGGTPRSGLKGGVTVDGQGSGWFSLSTRNPSGNYGERIRVSSSGNVGIGLTNPDWHLDIKSTSANAVVRLKSTGSTNGGQLQVNSDDLILRNRDAGNLQLWTNDAERLRIASDGAITVTSDGSDNDGANITLKHANNNTTDTVSALIFSNNGGEVARIVGSTDGGNNNGVITFHTDNAGTTGERVRITSAGDFYLNRTSQLTDAKLSVQSMMLERH